MDERSVLIEVQSRMRNAKNELVIAVLALEKCNGFINTITSLKETIGDFEIAIAYIDKDLESNKI
ncbi:MAG: hypothetical protein KAS66_09410 [Candidatus Omnitrophica bacterium]|nr:hypothetical protein [Candidatus Omnitrophota bacterium]